MPAYYFLYLLIFLGVLFLLVRYLLLRRTSLSTQLFIEGLRAENSGFYDEAATSYENALSAMKKNWFHRSFKIKISEKLKVLHTLNTYKRDQDFIRKNNSWIS
jgi:hypothetical protein